LHAELTSAGRAIFGSQAGYGTELSRLSTCEFATILSTCTRSCPLRLTFLKSTPGTVLIVTVLGGGVAYVITVVTLEMSQSFTGWKSEEALDTYAVVVVIKTPGGGVIVVLAVVVPATFAVVVDVVWR
jgi:hypothetical protein